jgi:RNase adapter protein RapZ
MTERKMAAAGETDNRMNLILYSFGFKYGIPIDANIVWDVRFLPNPYWQDELRPLSGLQRPIFDYVVASGQGQTFLQLLKPLLHFLVEAGESSGKRSLRLAVGCTGGRHRSVAIVEELHRFLLSLNRDVTVFHRDLDRDETRSD